MAPAALYTYPLFLPASLLQPLRAHTEGAEGDPAAVQQVPAGSLAVAAAVRRTWEVTLPDALHETVLERIEAVRPDLAAHFGLALEPCDAVAALRYPPGAFYRSHRDVSAQPDVHGLHLRAVSLVIFLNSAAPVHEAAYGGGSLRFHEGPGAFQAPHDVTPVAGTLVAFPSWWLHEVRPVAWGVRCTMTAWLLRAAAPEP